jgi:hypothetical protein
MRQKCYDLAANGAIVASAPAVHKQHPAAAKQAKYKEKNGQYQLYAGDKLGLIVEFLRSRDKDASGRAGASPNRRSGKQSPQAEDNA